MNAFGVKPANVTNLPGIYLILSPTKYYVGSASNLRERLKSHSEGLVAKSHSNPILLNSYLKYGSLKFVPLKVIALNPFWDRQELKTRLLKEEQTYLDIASGCQNCMNINFKASIPPDCSIPIVSIDRDGRENHFSSSIKAATHHNILNQNVCAVLKGRAKTSGGLTFFYENEDKDFKKRFDCRTQKRAVKSISPSGIEKEFDSINGAARALGLWDSDVGAYLRGKKAKTNGYKFSYL